MRRNYCNVHLDNIAIRLGNYNANAPQHVVDELFWQDRIVPARGRIGLPTLLVDILGRAHPVIPNLCQVTAVTKDGSRASVSRLLARLRQLPLQASQQDAGKTYSDDRVMFMIEVTGL